MADARTPASAGYRWPAEWEPHAATWLTWPHNRDTWPGCLEEAEAAFVEMVRALAGREEVRVNVLDEEMEARVRAHLHEVGIAEGAVRFFAIPSDDAWVRDHGPLFVTREQAPSLAAVDFGFDAWGRKYPPWDRDALVARRCIEALGVPRFPTEWVLEPGSVDGDGQGTVLTSESCLLHSNRCRPGTALRTRQQMETRLADWLGARQVIWLQDGIAGDDTDGHVDDVARFIAPGRVVHVLCDDGSDPDFGPLGETRRRLREARDARGRALDLVALPSPPPVFAESGERCPASYANFYLANGVALVPTFGAPTDQRALAILGDCLEDREIVAIDARILVVGLGAVHCLTQQVPDPSRGSSADG